MSRVKLAMALAVLTTVLAACSGGGSGDGNASTPITTNNDTGNIVSHDNLSPPTLNVPVPSTPRAWFDGSAIFVPGSTKAYMPSTTSLTGAKLMAVFALSDETTTKVYASLGDYATGSWGTPIQLGGSTGVVQCVISSTYVNQPPTATVVTANPTTGDAIAAWTTQATNERYYRVWTSTYSATGRNWATAIQVGTATDSGLRVTNTPAGAMAIAWTTSSTTNVDTAALKLLLVKANGSKMSDTLELGTSWYPAALKLGMDDAERLTVVWAGQDKQILMAQRGTSSWAAPVMLGTGSVGHDAQIDLAVDTQTGGAAVAWAGVDPTIHTVVFDADGNQTASALIYGYPQSNDSPALASRGAGRYLLVFGSSSLRRVYNLPFSAAYDPASGWSAALQIDSNGPSGTGNCNVKVDAAGNAVAVINAYNQGVFMLNAGASTWEGNPHIAFAASVPAFSMDTASGQAAILREDGNQLVSNFYR